MENEFYSKNDSNVNEKETVEQVKETVTKKKGKVGDIIRYIFGGLFVLGGLANFKNGNGTGIVLLLFSLSLMPFVYKNFLCKFFKNPKTLKTLQIVLPAVLIIILAIVSPTNEKSDNSYSSSSNNSSETTTSNNPPETPKEEKKELTESEKMIMKILVLVDEGLAFDTGDYIKGDIPAGEYAFVKFSGSGSYYSEEDGSGNIIDNENFDSFGYVKVHAAGNLTTNGVLINVSAFEKLEVSGAKQIYEILNEQTDYNEAGYYKVGFDIPEGQYVIESYGSGYWAIMTAPVGSNDIIDNDNFNGRASINVKNGQYLEVSRAKITQQ